jgi:hypothetical protein
MEQAEIHETAKHPNPTLGSVHKVAAQHITGASSKK